MTPKSMATIKVLPHNDEAEQSVLGAILIDKDAIVGVSIIKRLALSGVGDGVLFVPITIGFALSAGTTLVIW